ncbi:hypothetical protein X777_12050 [Ooceraea biroi]|uniref:Uncharacterized protein n=1 Tax=Ooceraea biroi TaxID=2015173 RepID=A0A026WZS0_OOCBI|nr:hypothetical protein X777_12050 [Ooceraea biroi]
MHLAYYRELSRFEARRRLHPGWVHGMLTFRITLANSARDSRRNSGHVLALHHHPTSQSLFHVAGAMKSPRRISIRSRNSPSISPRDVPDSDDDKG